MSLREAIRMGVQAAGIREEDAEIITSNTFLSKIKIELLATVLFITFYFLPVEKLINAILHTQYKFIWRILFFIITFTVVIRTSWFKNL